MSQILKKDLPGEFDIQGHRGCRGLLPENSLPAFRKALELGVTTLEMDLVISKDKKVIVSHEPYFNHEITLTPEGKEIEEREEKSFNLYCLDHEAIKAFDCGTRIHPRFPGQKKINVYKPLLSDVIELAEAYAEGHGKTIHYNVEVKSTPEGDNIFHPPVEEFCDLVCEAIGVGGIRERTLIQSFDLRALTYLHTHHPEFSLSLLVENPLSPDFNIRILGFVPQVYSPDFRLVDKALIQYAHDVHMKVIPWTVNDAASVRSLISLGVDGIITDYPDLFK